MAGPMFAKIGIDGSLWAPVLEKAIAKHFGNYLHQSGGSSKFGMRLMTGWPQWREMHD